MWVSRAYVQSRHEQSRSLMHEPDAVAERHMYTKVPCGSLGLTSRADMLCTLCYTRLIVFRVCNLLV